MISRETVCIALTVAALHDLEVKAADILNACVMAPHREKIWPVLDPEFGDEHILQNACENWSKSHVMLTLTCG